MLYLQILCFNIFLYCKVSLHDPDSLEICHTLEAHTAALSHFDIGGNLLATCGFSSRYLDQVEKSAVRIHFQKIY